MISLLYCYRYLVAFWIYSISRSAKQFISHLNITVCYIFMYFFYRVLFCGKDGFLSEPMTLSCYMSMYVIYISKSINHIFYMHSVPHKSLNKQQTIINSAISYHVCCFSFYHNIQLLTIDIVSKSIWLNFYIIHPTSFMSIYQSCIWKFSYESSHFACIPRFLGINCKIKHKIVHLSIQPFISKKHSSVILTLQRLIYLYIYLITFRSFWKTAGGIVLGSVTVSAISTISAI